jgi:hypothetical protein
MNKPDCEILTRLPGPAFETLLQWVESNGGIVSDHIHTIGETLCILNLLQNEVSHEIPGLAQIQHRLADLYQNIKAFEM